MLGSEEQLFAGRIREFAVGSGLFHPANKHHQRRQKNQSYRSYLGVRFRPLIGISPNPGLRRRVIPGIVGSSLEIYGEREQANHNGDHKNVFRDGFSGSRCWKHQKFSFMI
jgi:hypothetical protein